MWEQIRANRRKSFFLVLFMAVLLIALGGAVGLLYVGRPEGGVIGVGIALVIWLILCLTAFAGGDGIMLASAGARQLERGDMPRLFNVVEEMTIAAGLPKVPDVYLIESNAANAFAVGTPKRAVVAVTTGLLSRLSRDELQGVIAHEIGHIANFDCRFMVLAGVFVGAIVMISDLFLRGLRHARFSGEGRRSRGGGQAQLIFFLIAIALAILAPIFARLLYFACSRKREYLADASSARFTRYPEGLASALEKIEQAASGSSDVNRVLAPMYIINPLQLRGAFGLWATHPSTAERIRILRSLVSGASYAQYEAAFRAVRGGGLLGASAVADQAEVAVRPPSGETEPLMATRRREAMDVIHRLNGFRVAQCSCGTRIKVPPVYKGNEIACPSCGKSATITDVKQDSPPPAEPMHVRLETGQKWQTIECSCGAAIPVSPTFSGERLRCSKCGRRIEIEQQK